MASVHFDFAGETVVITGASRGIGLGVAEAFAKAGGEVWLLAEDDVVHEAASRLSERTRTSVGAIQADIRKPEQLEAALVDIPKIDVLVNNAGLELITPLSDNDPATLETFRTITDVNVNGSFQMTRAALAKIPRGGRIIFTASIWSRTAVSEFSAYVASKHAVLGLTRSLAHELGPRGITVNAVCPGWVRTAASMRSLAAMANRTGRSEDHLLREVVAAQVLDGLMEPADIAQTYLFLASPAAANITGQGIVVDRGEIMA